MNPDLSRTTDDTYVFRNMATHLRGLAEDVARVATAISNMAAGTTPSPSLMDIRNLQKVDMLQQSLCDLAVLADAMARHAHEREIGFQDLKLAVTRSLLKAEQNPDMAKPGSVDLF